MSSVEIERALIGMCLNSPRHHTEAIASGLKPEAFADDLCREIWTTMLAMKMADREIELVSICLEMKAHRIELTNIALNETPITGNVKLYVDTILDDHRDTKILRMLKDVEIRILDKHKSGPYADAKLTDEALDRLFNEVSKASNESQIATTDKILDQIAERWEREHKNPDDRRFIPTGFPKLDATLNGGIPKGALCTLGASTGRGKSLMGINIATRVAMAGYSVLYVTHEMDEEDVYERIIADIGNAEYQRVISPERSDREYDAFHSVWKKFYRNVRLDVFHDMQTNIVEVDKKLRYASETKPYDLVVIDYIQQFHVRKNLNAQENGRELSNYLKIKMAKKHNVAVLACAQMNRNAEVEGISGLRTGNIADSSSIERDSDIVLFLAHEDPNKPSQMLMESGFDSKNFAWLKLAKQRKGRSNTSIPLRFNPQFARFEEL